MNRTSPRRFLTHLAAALLGIGCLASCGGGGGEKDEQRNEQRNEQDENLNEDRAAVWDEFAWDQADWQ